MLINVFFLLGCSARCTELFALSLCLSLSHTHAHLSLSLLLFRVDATVSVWFVRCHPTHRPVVRTVKRQTFYTLYAFPHPSHAHHPIATFHVVSNNLFGHRFFIAFHFH